MLIGVPSSDGNFKTALESALLETLDNALCVRGWTQSKTAFNSIRAEMKRHYAESHSDFSQFPTYAEFVKEFKEKDAKIHRDRDRVKEGCQDWRVVEAAKRQLSGELLEAYTKDEPSNCQNAQLANVPPSEPSEALVPVSSDAPEYLGENLELIPLKSVEEQMGDQLTDQYHRATEGMRAVVKFGAMLMQIRDALGTGSTRGHGGKFGDKGTGLEAWLKQFAPSVPHATAYRFLSVAEAVQESFKLPAKAEKMLGFAGFVTATPDQLTEMEPAWQAKQLELWECIDGTSQRSWLDRLRPKKRGGDNTPRDADGKRIAEDRRSALEIKQAEARLAFDKFIFPFLENFVHENHEALLDDERLVKIHKLVIAAHAQINTVVTSRRLR
jgi:hypothetical protein